MPSMEIFNQQTLKYKKQILDKKPKIILEAASSFGWHKYLNTNDIIFGLDNFGESGKGEDLFNHFGFNVENLSKMIKKVFNDYT